MLFRLTDVYKSFGAQDVLRGASFQINPGEHVGLVGRNGAGKTTIFRLVNEEETPDSGEVARARGLKLGLLAQHVHFPRRSDCWRSMFTSTRARLCMNRRWRRLAICNRSSTRCMSWSIAWPTRAKT